MDDPPRLRLETGSLESLLLRSSPILEPPPDAEEEVWNRIRVATAAGIVAGAAGISAHAAAAGGSRVVLGALWAARLKWAAIVALAVPTVGVAAHYVLARPAAVLAKTVTTARMDPAPRSSVPSQEVVLAPPEPDPVPMQVPGVQSAHARAAEHGVEPGSELKKESRAVSAARAKFANGDAPGALDDVKRLEALFPRGGLIQEREVLAIDCFAAMGDRDGMKARAQAFLDTFPGSPYEEHVRRLLAR